MTENSEKETRDFIRKIKSTCVGIGLVDREKNFPREVLGTGFIVDPQGYLFTASHVIDELNKKRTALRKQGIECSISAIMIAIKGNGIIIKHRGLSERRRVEIKPTEKFPAPSNYDVIMCRMVGKESWPYLILAKPRKIELYEKIFVCGYPGGNATFNLADFETGIRLSPQFQTGHVSSVMPIDDVVNPTGIQTDIIGTGGSSGSPIIDSNGEVIGVAQNVIASGVVSLEKQDELFGFAQIGLIFGISNYGLFATMNALLEQMKKELSEEGILKPEFKKKYEESSNDYLKIDLKEPEKPLESSKDEFEK